MHRIQSSHCLLMCNPCKSAKKNARPTLQVSWVNIKNKDFTWMQHLTCLHMSSKREEEKQRFKAENFCWSLLWKFQWRNNAITCLANMLNVSVSSQCLSRKLRALAQPNTRVFQALQSDVVAVVSAGVELWLQTGAVAQRWSCLTDIPSVPPVPPQGTTW